MTSQFRCERKQMSFFISMSDNVSSFLSRLTNRFISSTCCDVNTRGLERAGFHWGGVGGQSGAGASGGGVGFQRAERVQRGKSMQKTQQMWHEKKKKKSHRAISNQDKPFQQRTVNAAHGLKCCLSPTSCYIERLCIAFIVFPSSHQQSTTHIRASSKQIHRKIMAN